MSALAITVKDKATLHLPSEENLQEGELCGFTITMQSTFLSFCKGIKSGW